MSDQLPLDAEQASPAETVMVELRDAWDEVCAEGWASFAEAADFEAVSDLIARRSTSPHLGVDGAFTRRDAQAAIESAAIWRAAFKRTTEGVRR